MSTTLVSVRTGLPARPTCLKISDKTVPKKNTILKADCSVEEKAKAGDTGAIIICSVSTGHVETNGDTAEAKLLDGPSNEKILTTADCTVDGASPAEWSK